MSEKMLAERRRTRVNTVTEQRLEQQVEQKAEAPKDHSFLLHWGINAAVGVFCFLFLIVNQLTNQYDGVWASSVFQAGKWEVSLGRWFWPVLDFLRGGYAGDPGNSLLSIAFLSLGNVLVFSLFDYLHHRRTYLYEALLMVSTTVCVFLSYRFMSPTFALSYVLAVSSVYSLQKCKNPLIGNVVAVASLCLSLALYQASIGCACVLILVLCMLHLLKDTKSDKSFDKIVFRSVIMLVVGIFLYAVIWRVIMLVGKIEAPDYKAADSLSILSILLKLPESFFQAYGEFFHFFFGSSLRHNIFQGSVIYVILWSVPVLGLLLSAVLLLKKKLHKGISLLVCIFLLPVACNFCLLLAPDNALEMQMTIALTLFIPVTLLYVDIALSTLLQHKAVHSAGYVAVVLTICLLYGNVYQVANDMNVMYEGRMATESLLKNVTSTVVSNGLYDENGKYLFIGVPSESPMYQKSSSWQRANQYARFGQWWEDSSSQRSYRGVLRRMGIHLPMYAYDESSVYDAYLHRNDDVFRSMPLYPAEGSVQMIDGVLAIKISNSPYNKGTEKPIENEQLPVLGVWYDHGFANYFSIFHVTTREDINYLQISDGNTVLGTWSANEAEITPYPQQHCKEWTVNLIFEHTGVYDNLHFNTSRDGLDYYTHCEGAENPLVVMDPPVLGALYEPGYAGKASTIYVTTRDDIQFLTLNHFEEELGNWQASNAIMNDGETENSKVWVIEYTFHETGVYDLWFRASADGNAYYSYSPGIENAMEIKLFPVTSVMYESGNPSTIHVQTDANVESLSLYQDDEALGQWNEQNAQVILSDDQLTKEWVIVYPHDGMNTEAFWYSVSVDGRVYDQR